MRIRAIGFGLLEVLFPGRCLLCGAWLLGAGADDTPVCSDCLCSLAPISGARCETCGTPLVSEHGTCLRCREASFAFACHRSIFAYAGAARDLIASLKFEHRSRLSGFFARLAAERIVGEKPGVPVVPVPGRRSADAVELIVRQLEARHGITVLRLLRRSGGRQQKSLDLRERRENLRGKVSLAGQKVPAEAILFDDIFTTGATTDTCTRVLMEGGCRKVTVLSLAMEE
ncbi:MAG TPA: double zinc ribbon domain-containing protein [Spirochaetia bacterium]|nr:double zinc ribbon domain-containing protein [Spirochaetia bacterium]